MSWDGIAGSWNQVKAAARQQWGKLTDDQRNLNVGRHGRFVGKIHLSYGITKQATQEQITEWMVRQLAVESAKADRAAARSRK